ncbi:hypothetical protein CENSYa_0073 [Cenarchaeum symbiosum A]|uniref:Uncharacterized protein n=1 Tax=Cenarchaeum symbiosum (strain A) TaxID=414004 RepID=A0RTQ1_CENSY|nr:hypothetical protein CENSYa_0073 [Cenarchaeum symbiosum A]
MVNKGFPKFGMSQAGAFVADLKNYNLPDFILELVAKDCNSELLPRGRIDDRLQSMNDDALEYLHRVFVGCMEDKAGKSAQLRFYAYVSSIYHKCEVLINEPIPGKSGKNHKVPVAVKNNGMYIAVAFNKATGKPVNTRDTSRFYDIVDDIKCGEHGTQLTDAIYGSSVGFRGEALVELDRLGNSRTGNLENKLDFKTANFENNIYSITKAPT